MGAALSDRIQSSAAESRYARDDCEAGTHDLGAGGSSLRRRQIQNLRLGFHRDLPFGSKAAAADGVAHRFDLRVIGVDKQHQLLQAY